MFTFTALNDKQRCKSAKENYTIGIKKLRNNKNLL